MKDFLPKIKSGIKENRILQIVFNADLRCSHDGLTIQAKKAGVTVSDLEIGEFIVFINAKKTMLKIYAAGNTIAHFKNQGYQRINLGILKMIPRFFNGKELKYDEALAEVIRQEIRV